ncbi:unnamed protein product [Boreogadus saida]
MYSAVIHKVESTTKLLAHSVVFPTLWMSVLLATGGREPRAQRTEGGTLERRPGAQNEEGRKREREKKRKCLSHTWPSALCCVTVVGSHGWWMVRWGATPPFWFLDVCGPLPPTN